MATRAPRCWRWLAAWLLVALALVAGEAEARLSTQRTTQSRLQSLAREHGAVRVGSTRNVESRRGDYAHDGYSGVMYHAPTRNMQQREDYLLHAAKEAGQGRYNVHSTSNNDAAQGSTYVIVGQKRHRS